MRRYATLFLAVLLAIFLFSELHPAFARNHRSRMEREMMNIDNSASETERQESNGPIDPDTEPPQRGKPMKKAKFYFRRSIGAAKAGNTEQQRDDIKKSVEYLRQLPVVPQHKNGARLYFKVYLEAAKAESLSGSRKQAIDYVNEAITKGEETGDFWVVFWLADVYARKAGLLITIGKLEEAEKTLEKLQKALDEIEMDNRWDKFPDRRKIIWKVKVKKNQAQLAEKKGELKKAEALLRESIELAGSDEQVRANNLYRYQISDLSAVLMKQGRMDEAEVEARRALTITEKQVGKKHTSTARALVMLTRVIMNQGRYDMAEKLARETLAIYESVGASQDSFLKALTYQKLGTSLISQGKWDEGIKQFEIIRSNLGNQKGIFRKRFKTDIAWMIALYHKGLHDEAIAALETINTEKNSAKGSGRDIKLGVFAAHLSAKGEYVRALELFHRVLPNILSRSLSSKDTDDAVTLREQRLKFVLTQYLDLLAKIRGTGIEKKTGMNLPAEGFKIANIARGQAVENALLESAARGAATNPELAEIARREQDIRKQIPAYYGILTSVLKLPSGDQDPEVIKDLQSKIEKLRMEREDILKDIEKRFPGYARLINPKPAGLEEARVALLPGETIISFFVGDRYLHTWAVPHSGEILYNAVEVKRDNIEEEVAILRSSLDPNAGSIEEIPDYDLKTAYSLFDKTLKPVEASWRDAKTLIIVPHGALGSLPLSVLPTQEAKIGADNDGKFTGYRNVPWLAKSHATVMLPSVASLEALRTIKRDTAERHPFTGFGDPY
ncbi:MAG: CHAT domain-containing protein, partial [Rhodospirillales bacterium]|nr:CHAT domain-containing protein [Rhodospirillales bacterium]